MNSVEIKIHLNSCRCLKKQIPTSCTNACVCPVPQAHWLPAEHCSASENQYCRRKISFLLASYQNQTLFLRHFFAWLRPSLTAIQFICFLLCSLPATMLKHQTTKTPVFCPRWACWVVTSRTVKIKDQAATRNWLFLKYAGLFFYLFRKFALCCPACSFCRVTKP